MKQLKDLDFADIFFIDLFCILTEKQFSLTYDSVESIS